MKNKKKNKICKIMFKNNNIKEKTKIIIYTIFKKK